MPTTAAPTTNRPVTADDLDEDSGIYGVADHSVVTVYDLDRFAAVPGALAALGTLLDTLRADEGTTTRPALVIDTSGLGQISVRQPLTPVEATKELAARQSRYDRGRDAWQTYLDDGTRPANYVWDYYLRREGITAPKDAE